MEKKKVLLFIKNPGKGNDIKRAFLRSGFDTTVTASAHETIEILKNNSPNVLIVDWDYVEGELDIIIDFVKENCRKTGLILMSDNKDLEDRIQAMEEGADECIQKPSEVDELIARVNALIRRIDLVDGSPKMLKVKDIQINLDTHEVRKGEEILDLTYTQFKLLYLLASKRDYVFTRSEILKKVWGDNSYVTDRTVDVHVKRLREKLGEGKNRAKYIQTIHGLGYRFA